MRTFFVIILAWLTPVLTLVIVTAYVAMLAHFLEGDPWLLVPFFATALNGYWFRDVVIEDDLREELEAQEKEAQRHRMDSPPPESSVVAHQEAGR